MSDPDKKLQCADHGESVATFVCRHLCSGVACGYHCSDEADGDPWPDAWCDRCHEALNREGEWNDTSAAEAGITLLCSHCYEDARKRNLETPEPLRAGQTATDETTLRELFARASLSTKVAQERAKKLYGLGLARRWGADYENAQFTLADGEVPSIVADMQVVGTISKKSSSWLWAWNNEIIEPKLYREVERLRVLGEVRGIAALSEPYLENVEEGDGWELTSLARHILGWDAIYRAPMDDRYLFMLLRNFRRTS